jgi:hypothetical protein
MNYKKFGDAEDIDYSAVGSPKQQKDYEEFVLKVKEKYLLKTYEEANAKAQELIKNYHKKEAEREFK